MTEDRWVASVLVSTSTTPSLTSTPQTLCNGGRTAGRWAGCGWRRASGALPAAEVREIIEVLASALQGRRAELVGCAVAERDGADRLVVGGDTQPVAQGGVVLVEAEEPAAKPVRRSGEQEGHGGECGVDGP